MEPTIYKGVEDAEPFEEFVIEKPSWNDLQQHEPPEEITTTKYEGWDFGRHRPRETRITQVKMDRQEFPVRTIGSPDMRPLVCREFCDKSKSCKLIENGFPDLCRHRSKHGKLVRPVNLRWSAKFNRMKDDELKARTLFARSTISGVIPEIALSHDKTDDPGMHSCTVFDTWDDIEGDIEEEAFQREEARMHSGEKSQQGTVPSYIYRTVYRDRRVLTGFETRTVEMTYVDTERKWIFSPPDGRFILSIRKVIRTTSYRDDVPIYKWIRIPTLRPIGCLLKPVKVVGSTTVVTRKEQKFYANRREERRFFSQFVGKDRAAGMVTRNKQVVTATR